MESLANLPLEVEVGPCHAQTFMVDPDEILFTQDSIEQRFKTGAPSAVTVAEAQSYSQALALGDKLLLSKAIAQLIKGTLRVEDFPPIRVVRNSKDQQLYSLDNRRLYVFRQYACALRSKGLPSRGRRSVSSATDGRITATGAVQQQSLRVPAVLQTADEEFFRKLTTSTCGADVRLRTRSAAAAGLESKLHTRPFHEASRAFEALVLVWGKEATLNPNMYRNKVRCVYITMMSEKQCSK